MDENYQGHEIERYYPYPADDKDYFIEYINVDGEDFNLMRDENNIPELDFSHAVLKCEKLNRFCDYEYKTCPYYEKGNIQYPGGGWHCKHGASIYLHHEDAMKLRPEWCNKIKKIVGVE